MTPGRSRASRVTRSGWSCTSHGSRLRRQARETLVGVEGLLRADQGSRRPCRAVSRVPSGRTAGGGRSPRVRSAGRTGSPLDERRTSADREVRPAESVTDTRARRSGPLPVSRCSVPPLGKVGAPSGVETRSGGSSPVDTPLVGIRPVPGAPRRRPQHPATRRDGCRREDTPVAPADGPGVAADRWPASRDPRRCCSRSGALALRTFRSPRPTRTHALAPAGGVAVLVRRPDDRPGDRIGPGGGNADRAITGRLFPEISSRVGSYTSPGSNCAVPAYDRARLSWRRVSERELDGRVGDGPRSGPPIGRPHSRSRTVTRRSTVIDPGTETIG